MHLNPPVNRFSPRADLEDWIAELERLRGDPELQDAETQETLQGHLNDALTWLRWDLHRRVLVDGGEATRILREVGALDRQPGDPPPPDETGDGEPASGHARDAHDCTTSG